ncbi:PAAR domain-containing protein [Variovorax ureilyticus]|uniref:PAAR domain-containing protein n=1 Tax=Variovorax ureilyticus TaxID=1836198 RepID=A0ABU8VAM2_9BURK
MSRRVILVGDTTTHGGKVISGAANNTVHDRPIARLLDEVDCPLHGVNKIIEGEASYDIGGRPVALEGHRTECGSVLIGSIGKTAG